MRVCNRLASVVVVTALLSAGCGDGGKDAAEVDDPDVTETSTAASSPDECPDRLGVLKEFGVSLKATADPLEGARKPEEELNCHYESEGSPDGLFGTGATFEVKSGDLAKSEWDFVTAELDVQSALPTGAQDLGFLGSDPVEHWATVLLLPPGPRNDDYHLTAVGGVRVGGLYCEGTFYTLLSSADGVSLTEQAQRAVDLASTSCDAPPVKLSTGSIVNPA